MSSNQDHQSALDAERARNEWYLEKLERRLQQGVVLAGSIGVAQNTIWTGTGINIAPSRAVVGPLIGRVGLNYADEDLGRSFYIGPWNIEEDNFMVVNWAAPVAQLFFRGSDSESNFPDPESLEATRTFETRSLEVIGFTQENLRPLGLDPFAAGDVQQAVPQAPQRAPRPEQSRLPSREMAAAEDELTQDQSASRDAQEPPTSADQDVTPIPDEVVEPPRVTPASSNDELESRKPLRAEEIVKRAISSPRSGRLKSVLSTLQPEQHHYVTWPSSKFLVVQGQPGTGKTIVATHRAGYLTHPENETDHVDKLLLLGPTTGWVHHVRDVVSEIGANGVEVRSLESLIRHYSGGLTHKLHREDESWFQFDWETARLGERAVRKLRGQYSAGTAHNLKRVVNELVKPTELHRELVTNPETSHWLFTAKSFDHARSRAEFMPFLASVAVAINPPTRSAQFDHVIIDEAQDLRPMEWFILNRLLDGDGATYSLFGDMNQRRADFSYPSWHDVAVNVVGADDESRFEPEVLEIGYRSTRQILDYAALLLPNSQRHVVALREGDEPVVIRKGPGQIVQAAVEALEELASRHSPGIAALIATNSTAYERELIHHQSGWRKTDQRYVLQKEGKKVWVLGPTDARGQEFDAVLVVEPSDFPENVGRKGQLYTSLTRATTELRVIHSKAMPRELRRRR